MRQELSAAEERDIHAMPSSEVITRLPVPEVATAMKRPSAGDHFTDDQLTSAADARDVQLMPSGEVITRFPVPLVAVRDAQIRLRLVERQRLERRGLQKNGWHERAFSVNALTNCFREGLWRRMRPALSALILFACTAPACAITGSAPPASGAFARSIVMLVDEDGDLCTATAIARDVVLTAAHCVVGEKRRSVRVYQVPSRIAVRSVKRHPAFDARAYAAARATADLALVKLSEPLPDIVAPAELAPARRVEIGETLTIAGFGVTKAYTPYGLGIPREAKLAVTGQPGSLQIRLVDPETRDRSEGLGACTGDSGAPAFDADGRIVGVVSWSTAPNAEDGCGGLTGLTPLLTYGAWILRQARNFGAPSP
jgi:Trypsin